MPAQPKLRVTASALNVREDHSLNSGVVGFLKKDDIVDHLETSEDKYWLKIKKSQLTGWASHKYLMPVTPETEEEFPWMPIALAEIGIKEIPGEGDNPRIVQYLRSTTLNADMASNDETPWCSAFANWCMERSGYEGTDSAWAQSWIKWGVEAEEPRRGCIVVFKREGGGHVGFYISETSTHINVLGGNQSDQVKISGYPKKDRLGYRLPG